MLPLQALTENVAHLVVMKTGMQRAFLSLPQVIMLSLKDAEAQTTYSSLS
jgi:hypothetical protein